MRNDFLLSVLYLLTLSMCACSTIRQLKDVDMVIVSDDSLHGAYVRYVPTKDTLKYTNVDLGLFIPYLAAYKMKIKKDEIQFYSFLTNSELPETMSKCELLSEHTRQKIADGEYSIILCSKSGSSYLPIRKVEICAKNFVLDFYDTDLYYLIFFRELQFGRMVPIKAVYNYYKLNYKNMSILCCSNPKKIYQ